MKERLIYDFYNHRGLYMLTVGYGFIVNIRFRILNSHFPLQVNIYIYLFWFEAILLTQEHRNVLSQEQHNIIIDSSIP